MSTSDKILDFTLLVTPSNFQRETFLENNMHFYKVLLSYMGTV